MKIVFRGDSGFCRWKMLRWCERHEVKYLVGLAQNARLKAMLAPQMLEAEAAHQRTKEKVRLFSDLDYAAGTWDKKRRVDHADHAAKAAGRRGLSHPNRAHCHDVDRRRALSNWVMSFLWSVSAVVRMMKAAVCYVGDRVIGGGWIERTELFPDAKKAEPAQLTAA